MQLPLKWLGAFDYLVKPVDLSVLVTKVNEAYAKKEAVKEKIRKAKTEQIIRHPLAVFDREREWFVTPFAISASEA